MPLVIPPFGISPLGMFTPKISQFDREPPPGVLADDFDYETGELRSITKGMDPIDEQFLIALTKIRATGAAVENVGARFVDVEKIDEATQMRLFSEAQIALQRLIQRQDIRLLSVDVTDLESPAGVDGKTITASYFNLRASNPNDVRRQSVKVPNVRALLK